MQELEKNIDIITKELLKQGILPTSVIVMGGTRKEKTRLLVDTLAGIDLDTYMCFVQVLETLKLKKLVELFVDESKEKPWFIRLGEWHYFLV